MVLEFLKDPPQRAYRVIESDLRLMNPKLDMRVYLGMTPEQLDRRLLQLGEREDAIYRNRPYASWYESADYIEVKLLQEALTQLRDYRELQESEEILVPGYSYYRKLARTGDLIEGEMCVYLGEDGPVNWVGFRDAIPAMKALEVIRHGTGADFRKIYVEMADGRADGLSRVRLEHVLESSDAALREIGAYSDTRWEGPWPWETNAPLKLRRIIEDKVTMRKQSLQEMQAEFNDLLQKLTEGEAEKFDAVQSASDMEETVQKMIDNLARLAGEGMIKLRDKVRAAVGDDMAMRVEHAMTQPINMAADMLSKLRVSMAQITQELQNAPADEMGMQGGLMGDMGGMGGGMGGGDMGMGGGMGGMPGDDMGMGGVPGDDMGMDGMPGDEMAMADGEPERAMKKA